MAAGTTKNFVLLIGALVLAGVAYQAYDKKSKAPPPKSATPPANAQFLEAGTTAEHVMTEYLGAKRGQEDAVAAAYAGLWVPTPGWTGAVEGSSDMLGTRAVSVYYYNNRIIGGGFWVLAHVTEPPNFKKGDHVRVTGQISAVQVLPGGITPIPQIVLDPAEVVAAPR